MKIEMIPVARIKPYPQNPKFHPEIQVQKLARAISEFKWDQPIVVDADIVVIKGHGRLLAVCRRHPGTSGPNGFGAAVDCRYLINEPNSAASF